MKKNVRRKSAWTRRSERPGALSLLCWCAALVALTAAGSIFLRGEAAAPTADVVISEVMSANAAAWPTPGGAFYDWMELWNRSDHAVRLDGCRVTNALDIRGAYALPEMELAPDGRLVLYCTEAREEGELCTGFALDKDGATLALMDADGAFLDSVRVPALRKGEAYALDEALGEWRITADYTPGLENSAEAHGRLRAQVRESGPVRISELMADNGGAVADADGDPSDWIELHNESDQPVRLAGWSLLDDAGKGGKSWSFPDVTIDAGGYLMVYASAKNRTEGGELHTSFRLSAEGETLYLLNAEGRIASAASYEALGENEVLSRDADGNFVATALASPGGEGGGSVQSRELSRNDENVYINEVMCSMSQGADWAELYNGGAAALDLSGWWLSDDSAHARKWEFPAGTGLAPGEYLVLILGDESDVAQAQSRLLRAGFALSMAGDELVLSRPDGSAADSVRLTNQRANVSYGRAEEAGCYRYFEQMTPGAANAGANYGAITGGVTCSVPGGRKSAPVTVELFGPSGAAIYYTTDGSDPSAASTPYQGPISVSSNTVLRAIAQAEDAMPSQALNCSYIFDDSSARKLVCISGDPMSLTGEGTGALMTGSKRKMGVGVEIYGRDGAQLVSQNCEFMISGHYTTKDQYPQKAIRLKAKRMYGDSKFRAKLFDGLPYEEYEAIVLRASGQDNRKAYMRDALLTSLAGDIGLYHQAYEMCIVYVNGEYWGLYYMREHVDADSVCQFEGWDPESASIDMLEGSGLYAMSGTKGTFREMMSFVNSEGLASDENVEKLRQWCDIENYLDYVAVQLYTEHEDLNNLRVYRNANGDGLWRWVVYDLDLSFLNNKNNVRMWLSSDRKIGSITQQDNTLFYQLMRNDKMRDYFLTRFGELLATTFSAENVGAKIQAQYDDIAEDMQRHTERWSWNYKTWQKRVKSMFNYSQARPKYLMDYLQRGFELSDEQMQHYFSATLATMTK